MAYPNCMPEGRRRRRVLHLAAAILIASLPLSAAQSSVVGTVPQTQGTSVCFGTLSTAWTEPTGCAALTVGFVTDPDSHATTDHWVYRGGFPGFPTQSLSCMPPRTSTTRAGAAAQIVPGYYTATAAGCPLGWTMAASGDMGGGTSRGTCCAAGYTLPTNGFPLCVSRDCGNGGTAAAYATGQGDSRGAPPTLVFRPTTIPFTACSATAMPIEVWWSNDTATSTSVESKSSLSSSLASSASVMTAPTPTPTTIPTSGLSSSTSSPSPMTTEAAASGGNIASLSKSAQIAVGVVAGVVALAILGGVTL